ncbi:hypothetical protein SUGI_1063130 [Cryptomeria japonica]|nr:hypothetical protein SUGI_1063130 [Cryptomeria japonica]
MQRQFFKVEFALESDKAFVLQAGPWKWNDSFIFVQNWSPNFDPTIMTPSNGSTWLRFHNLPFKFWSENCLKAIGDTLGQTINIDMGRDDFIRFARIEIIHITNTPGFINLKTKSGVWKQAVEIEKSKFFCLRCRSKNHNEEVCNSDPPPTHKVWKPKSEEVNADNRGKEIILHNIDKLECNNPVNQHIENFQLETVISKPNPIDNEVLNPTLSPARNDIVEGEDDNVNIVEPRTISQTNGRADFP